MSNPENGGRKGNNNIETIADCARLITQILTDNRETINLIFQDIKAKLKEDDVNTKIIKKRSSYE